MASLLDALDCRVAGPIGRVELAPFRTDSVRVNRDTTLAANIKSYF